MKAEEIAKIAGVSRSTVSRVINNYPNVPEETRQKVMEVIKKYNYRPNAFARTLAGKKSETIGVFFILDGDSKHAEEASSCIVHNDFFASYLDAIVDVANKNSYFCLVQTIVTESDYERVEKAFVEKRIDGGILIGTRKSTFDKVNISLFKQPLVVFDYDYREIPDIHKKQITVLNTNDSSGIEEAVNYLTKQGHKTIGFIKGMENTLSAKVRFNAYLRAIEDNGLSLSEEDILEGQFNQDIAYKAMEERIKSGHIATAYICANDYMAIAAIESLNAHGYQVPKDVSFIGIDNTRTGELMTPKLTTLAPDFEAMAREAVEIIKRKTSKKTVPELVEFNVELIKRESVFNHNQT